MSDTSHQVAIGILIGQSMSKLGETGARQHPSYKEDRTEINLVLVGEEWMGILYTPGNL